MSMPVAAMEAMLDPAAIAAALEQKGLVDARQKFIASDLHGDFDELVRMWMPVHRRMADDERRYQDSDQQVTAPTKSRPADGDSVNRDAPTLAITQSRTIITAARRADMLLPNNDNHGEVEPDDVPHIPEQDLPGGENMDPAEVRRILTARAEKMSERIRSQYHEARFEPKIRRMLEDSSRVGWGVIKGPGMGVRRRRVHRGQLAEDGETLTMVAVTEVVEETRPEIEYVNPWHFIADLAPTIEEAEKAFQIRLMTDRDVRELTMMPGFDRQAINRILQQKPVQGSPILASYAMKNQALGLVENLRDVYVFLEYNGPIRKKWAEEIIEGEGDEQRKFYRCEALCSKGADGQSVPFEWEDDGSPLPMVQVFFCQGEIVKFKESPLEQDSRLPYYVDTCHRIDDTFAGGGIPYLLRSIDRAIQASWQMGLHNAAMSSGPQIFLRKGVVTPADGKARSKGPKTWWVDEKVTSLKDVIHSIVIENNAAQFLQLLDKAMMLADEIINLPLTAQGKQSEETAQGQAVRLNTNNVFQKRMAMGTDDTVLVPLGERMIEWNLTYGDPLELGGDFKWVSKVNGLLVKDLQTQRLQAATVMTESPRFAPYVDNYTLLKRNFEVLEVATDGIVLPEKEAREKEAQMQQQAPDPMIEIKQQEVAIKGQKIEADTGIAHRKIDLADRDMQTKERIAEMSIEEAFARLALDEDITLADVQARIFDIREKSKLKGQEMGVKARVEAEKMAAKERADQVEIQAEAHRRPGPVLA